MAPSGDRNQIETRLRDAKQRRAALEAQIDALRKEMKAVTEEVHSLKVAGTYIFGPEWGRKQGVHLDAGSGPVPPREDWVMGPPGTLVGSQSQMAMAVLAEEGAPLHVREITERLQRLGYAFGLPSMTMTLARRARARKHIVKVAPGTFGLKQWADRPPKAPAGRRSRTAPGKSSAEGATTPPAAAKVRPKVRSRTRQKAR